MTQKTHKTRAKRKPHNARKVEYSSFNELLSSVAAEKRAARVGNDQVVMRRNERLFRLMLDRALKGNAREVTKLLQLMAKYPTVAATYRDEFVTVVSGHLCNV